MNHIFHKTPTFSSDAMSQDSVLKSPAFDLNRQKLIKQLQALEEVLKYIPNEEAEAIQFIEKYAKEAAEEAAKEKPSRLQMEITGRSLITASRNLKSVAPIAEEIAKTLLLISG